MNTFIVLVIVVSGLDVVGLRLVSILGMISLSIAGLAVEIFVSLTNNFSSDMNESVVALFVVIMEIVTFFELCFDGRITFTLKFLSLAAESLVLILDDCVV